VIYQSTGDERRLRRRYSVQVEQPEADRFEHALLSAVIVVTLLDARAEVQLAPFGLVFPTIIIPHLEVVAAVQVELPHVLHHGVTPHPAARAVVDMVIHLTVRHQRPGPAIQIAAIAAEPR